MGERAFIVTQSIKKLRAEDRGWALDKKGFKRLSDDKPADISNLPEDDSGLYYKDMPYTPHKLYQRLIITYFIGKMAVTGEDEAARIHHYLDTDKISEETLHDGLYACCWFFFGFGFNRLHQFPFVLQNVQTLPVKE